jgi:hypothetical protein
MQRQHSIAVFMEITHRTLQGTVCVTTRGNAKVILTIILVITRDLKIIGTEVNSRREETDHILQGEITDQDHEMTEETAHIQEERSRIKSIQHHD